MEHPPTLESVATAFQHWRDNRTHKGKTPAPLKALALALLQDHQPSQVKAALNINSTMLTAWQSESSAIQSLSSSPLAFVELAPALPTQAELPAAMINVTLTRLQGTTVTVSGPLTPAHLSALVQEDCANGGT